MKTLLRLLTVLLLPLTLSAVEKPLWLACGPAELLKALEPLAELRRAEGMEALLLPLMPAEALAKAPRKPDFMVIVGDDELNASAPAPWLVPAMDLPFHAWKETQRKSFPSDLAWAGLDRDGVPLVAVGRIPVRTAEEASTVVGKILAWEKKKPTRDDLALPMWGGDPIYSPQFTEMFMGFLFAQIEKNSPTWLEPWIVSGDVKHALCGWPATQARAFDERAARGALFTGFIGHGSQDMFCSVRTAGRWTGYLGSDARSLAAGTVRPPHVIFACECGQFDRTGGRRCLAEELLLAPGGPVLTVAATNDSHPLPNFYGATNLLRRVGQADGPVRFGSIWLRVQGDTRRRTDVMMEAMLKGVEGNYNAKMDQQDLKRDHVTLYAIFGDPATNLHTPHQLSVRVEKTERGWAWEATPPPGATRLIVEHRVPEPVFEARPEKADEVMSRELFEKGNAALAFHPIPAEGWRGETEQKGVLRFIVETPEGLWVAGRELK